MNASSSSGSESDDDYEVPSRETCKERIDKFVAVTGTNEVSEFPKEYFRVGFVIWKVYVTPLLVSPGLGANATAEGKMGPGRSS